MLNTSFNNKISGDSSGYAPTNQPNKKPMQTKVITKTSTKVLLALGLLIIGGGIVAAVAPLLVDDNPRYPSPITYTLSVIVKEPGFGWVTSEPDGINCGGVNIGTCRAVYKTGTQVTLAAKPVDSSFGFIGWSGGCAANDAAGTCRITMNSNKSIIANFKSLRPIVTTKPADVYGNYAHLKGSVNPNGSETLAWFRYSPADIGANPGSCNDTFGKTLPEIGQIKVGSGNTAIDIMQSLSGLGHSTTYYYCAIAKNSYGTSFGQLLSFTTPPPNVTLSVRKTGSGTIISNPKGIDCGTYCSSQFPAGSKIILTANPAVGYKFGKWSPNCVALPATGNACEIVLGYNVTSPYIVDAGFIGLTPSVNTKPADVYGNYAHLKGSVNPNGWDTTAWFRYGSTNPGSCNDTFGIRQPSSGGIQIGKSTSFVDIMDGIPELKYSTTYYYCAIAQNSNGKSFGQLLSFTTPTPTLYKLRVKPPIVGGSIASEVPYIHCGGSASFCDAAVPAGATVRLFVNIDPGYTFTSWTDDCVDPAHGDDICDLVMNSDKIVGATFTSSPTLYTVTITKPTGGLIYGSASNILLNCGDYRPDVPPGTACTATVSPGSFVGVKQMAAQGYTFAGWTGFCSNQKTDYCSFTMPAVDVTFGATFR